MASGVSIHSTQTGRDQYQGNQLLADLMFQSTLPKRVETQASLPAWICGNVSIHSTQTGRDNWSLTTRWNPWVFQSTLPKRVETEADEIFERYQAFQSTLPKRVETAFKDAFSAIGAVSIHSTQTGRDLSHYLFPAVQLCFNPLYPNG